MKHYYKGFLVAYSGEGVYALFSNNEAEVNRVWRKLETIVEVYNSIKAYRVLCALSVDELEVV